VKYMELWIDGALVNTTTCGTVTYSCQLWTPEPISPGSHGDVQGGRLVRERRQLERQLHRLLTVSEGL